MSKESAEKFLDKLEKDPAFRKKLEQANPAERKKMIEPTYKFTQEEFNQAFKEKHPKPLSSDQLRNISAASGHQFKSYEEYKDYIKTVCLYYE